MSVLVILRASCDGFTGKKPRKKCGAQESFEAPNIFACRTLAETNGWCFDTTSPKDKAYCPDCGPEIKPHMYVKRK